MMLDMLQSSILSHTNIAKSVFQKFACKIISECLDVVRNIEYPIDELHDMIQEINLDIDQKLHKKDLT